MKMKGSNLLVLGLIVAAYFFAKNQSAVKFLPGPSPTDVNALGVRG